MLGEPGTSTVANRLCPLGICRVQGLHAGLEAGGIEGIDCEGAVTALGAAGAAGEP